MQLTKLIFVFLVFFTIFYGFSKFQAIWSLKHYSYESMTLLKNPLDLFQLLHEVLLASRNIGGARELDSARGSHDGGRGVIEKHEEIKSYL